MSRSLCNAKLISSVVDNVSLVIIRRGFAAAATRGTTENLKQTARGRVEANKEESWVPDPITGYYRPENHGDEIDVADLREMLLSNRNH